MLGEQVVGERRHPDLRTEPSSSTAPFQASILPAQREVLAPLESLRNIPAPTMELQSALTGNQVTLPYSGWKASSAALRALLMILSSSTSDAIPASSPIRSRAALSWNTGPVGLSVLFKTIPKRLRLSFPSATSLA